MDRLTSIVSMQLYIHYLVQEKYRNSRGMPFSLIPSFVKGTGNDRRGNYSHKPHPDPCSSWIELKVFSEWQYLIA